VLSQTLDLALVGFESYGLLLSFYCPLQSCTMLLNLYGLLIKSHHSVLKCITAFVSDHAVLLKPSLCFLQCITANTSNPLMLSKCEVLHLITLSGSLLRIPYLLKLSLASSLGRILSCYVVLEFFCRGTLRSQANRAGIYMLLVCTWKKT
jgi:hypothetical protein